MNACEQMREVLDAADSFIVNLEIEPYSHLDEVARELRLKINAALALPSRNCDVGTPDEQGEQCMAQFDQWRRKGDGKKLITAIMAWAQAPYAAQEGAMK